MLKKIMLATVTSVFLLLSVAVHAEPVTMVYSCKLKDYIKQIHADRKSHCQLDAKRWFYIGKSLQKQDCNQANVRLV